MGRRRYAIHTAAVAVASCACMLAGGCPSNSPPPDSASIDFNTSAAPTPIDTADDAVFERGALFDSLAGKAGHHAPTIVAFGDGELLAAWYSYDGPHELDGAAIYMSRRPADGGVWSSPWLHIDRPEADGNPVLYAEGDAAWLFQAVVPGTGWSTSHVEFQRSADRGATWTAPQLIAGPIGLNVRHPPVRLATGDLLLPAYDDLLLRSVFYASADGESWSSRSDIVSAPPFNNLQPSIAQAADGRVLAVMRNAGRGWLWGAASGDAGRTWSAPADSGFANPASPAVLLRLASGNLVLIFNDSDAERRPLSITLSADDGRTWHPPRILVDEPGEHAYPGVCQTPDGRMHIVYSHDRAYVGHIVLNEAWVRGEE